MLYDVEKTAGNPQRFSARCGGVFVAWNFSQVSIFQMLTYLMVFALFILTILFWKCPHCGKYLGRSIGEYCPHCGEKLEK